MRATVRFAVRVWDPLQRLLHWTLVAAVAASWLTTLAFFAAHQPAGYIALAVVLVRVVWGFVGSRHARFSDFVRGPRATWAYLGSLRRHAGPRHLGHNPLGAWMVLALLGCIVALALSGWLYTTDALWGDATVETLHVALAWGLLGLIAVHVGGVLFASRRQHENLILAMITGDKAGPSDSDPR